MKYLFLSIAWLVITPGFKEKPVATAHPLATKAGLNILQKGGTAFDAAIAIASTLNGSRANDVRYRRIWHHPYL